MKEGYLSVDPFLFYLWVYGWMEEGGMSAVYLCIVSIGIWVNDGVCAALWLWVNGTVDLSAVYVSIIYVRTWTHGGVWGC